MSWLSPTAFDIDYIRYFPTRKMLRARFRCLLRTRHDFTRIENQHGCATMFKCACGTTVFVMGTNDGDWDMDLVNLRWWRMRLVPRRTH